MPSLSSTPVGSAAPMRSKALVKRLPWPAQALYLGTFQEAAFASGADAPTGASGQVLVERVGPGDADFGLVTLEHRATALEATAPQEAARISRRMVELQPRQAPGHYARARARVRLGDLDAAVLSRAVVAGAPRPPGLARPAVPGGKHEIPVRRREVRRRRVRPAGLILLARHFRPPAPRDYLGPYPKLSRPEGRLRRGLTMDLGPTRARKRAKQSAPSS